MIIYKNSLDKIAKEQLEGFFVGWPNPPSVEAHIRILEGSYSFWLAIDEESQKPVGFISAISDGVISAYIPLLEVLPAYQNNGIGGELVSRMLKTLGNLYMIDLLCDENLQAYYKKHSMSMAVGAFIRNHDRQSCD